MKAPVKLSPPTNQHPVFLTDWMPLLSPNQQCQSTERKSYDNHCIAETANFGLLRNAFMALILLAGRKVSCLHENLAPTYLVRSEWELA